MGQARVPTETEFRRLVAVASQGRHGPRNRAALMLSYLAGLRVGEIASLQWGNLVDVDGKVREQLRLSATVTKGGHARVVFMNARLRKEIEQFRTSLSATPAASQPLLITQKRTRFSANTLCQLMRGWYDLAGLDGGSSHSGRRWFITRLAHSGISPKAIMMLAGHRHLSTTQRYIDVNDEIMRAAVEVL
ncbi:integrase [Methylobacterium sp. Leaf119]|uniref:Site-specific integrase n=1 Tax=Methylorubrum extorquens TaxID=408 RepID=A0AAX3WQA9_METEX|nr:site-specific integrase [Methylorubrum extorquens]ABY28589.1 integrase family protein [Methylorubrum extorquens PA1]KQP85688.1 integrase [Methylobacterium sp. Leaf119]WHQ72588.1 site-specific integrase [Methylorubrum extorquens]